MNGAGDHYDAPGLCKLQKVARYLHHKRAESPPVARRLPTDQEDCSIPTIFQSVFARVISRLRCQISLNSLVD